jgi:glycosyltransferase involved in cell wall biosynthesis
MLNLGGKRMRVLYLITDLARDGAQRQLLELVKGLDKTRFRPIVLILHPSGPMENEFKAVPGARLIFLKRRGKYDLFCLFKIMSMLRRLKVDVVQPFLTPATFFGLLPALICRIPVKIATERLGPGRRKASLGYRFYLRLEDLLTRLVDCAVSNSQAGQGFLIERGIKASHVRVIYNGINFQRLYSSNSHRAEEVRGMLDVPPDGQVVGMMARLFPQKRHEIFLRAAALVCQDVPNTRFALLGDGPLRSYLENLSQELKLDSKVTFFGDQKDIGPYIAAFDIAVLTSETEGCSNSLLEAMALGKPVVATDAGGNRELILTGETGILVPLGDYIALASNIVGLLRDFEAARAIGQRAKQQVISKFSIEKMVQQYQDLYEETLREKSHQKGSEGQAK